MPAPGGVLGRQRNTLRSIRVRRRGRLVRVGQLGPGPGLRPGLLLSEQRTSSGTLLIQHTSRLTTPGSVDPPCGFGCDQNVLEVLSGDRNVPATLQRPISQHERSKGLGEPLFKGNRASFSMCHTRIFPPVPAAPPVGRHQLQRTCQRFPQILFNKLLSVLIVIQPVLFYKSFSC